jgi:hypothetical protein
LRIAEWQVCTGVIFESAGTLTSASRSMPRTVIQPTPRVSHRYKAEEMSGPLPQLLYKVLPPVYANRLVQGEMMWSTLSWFQQLEDVDRGDLDEGTRSYFPMTGLEVHRHERAGQPDDARFTLDGHGLVARAAQSDHIFVYSMTLDSTLRIGEDPLRACVEIFDPEQFVRRVSAAVQRHRTARADTLIHDTVRYWSPDNPPAEVWALPDRLTVHKHKDYERQQEYRLAFGTRADVFDFQRVEYFVMTAKDRPSKQVLDPQRHRLKLHVGSLADCCRLV